MQRKNWLQLCAFVVILAIVAITAPAMAQELKMESKAWNSGEGFDTHLNKRISDGDRHFPSLGYEKKKQPAWVKEMFQIKGVEGISIHQYHVSIWKAKLFEAKNLEPKVEAILKKHFGSRK